LGALTFYLPDAWPAPDLRRRALIIGIDKYELPSSPEEGEFKPSAVHAAAATAVKRNNRFHDLDGAVNDAELMNQILKDRFGFSSSDICFLKNEQATRDQILHTFQTHLIEAASPGDVSLFYYAGHGSQVQNLASDESDQLDETLVPSDAASGARDIRDKEMVRLYRAALKKNILLTVVLDSCHSGGMSRGVWNQMGKTRNLPPDPRAVNDPPELDPVTGKKLPDPSSMGMLFIGAAREDQPAGETTVTQRDGTGANKETSHGAFTAAFAQVLGSSIAHQSIEQLCDRVQAMLASEGKTQVPICAGAERGSRDLLNQPAGSGGYVTLPIESTLGKTTVRLHGGSALGLAPGCQLVSTSGQPVRLELTRVDLGMSEAKILGAAPTAPLRAGDLFKLETWVASPQAALKVFFAKDGPSADAVLATAKILASLAGRNGLQLISESAEETKPTHVLYWHEAAYHLERYPAEGKTTSLGPAPSVDTILGALDGASNVRLWFMPPPHQLIVADIRLGAGTENAAVDVIDNTAACTYLLTGRLNQGALEYSWIFKDAFLANPNQARLPLQSDWTASADQLTNLATRLGRIYSWLNLIGPTGGDPAFPYQLAFEKPGKKEAAGMGPFKFHDQYKFALQATPEALRQAAESGGVAKRYVYVFLIDSAGNATCFFPDPKNGNDQNLLPRDETRSPWIELTRNEHDIEVSEPAGTDNYFLIASEQPLDPGIFQWTGVRRRELSRGKGTPLEFLFTSAGESTRGAQAAHSVPATWSIESVSVRSGP
jgi:hypothetical protein